MTDSTWLWVGLRDLKLDLGHEDGCLDRKYLDFCVLSLNTVENGFYFKLWLWDVHRVKHSVAEWTHGHQLWRRLHKEKIQFGFKDHFVNDALRKRTTIARSALKISVTTLSPQRNHEESYGNLLSQLTSTAFSDAKGCHYCLNLAKTV